MKQLVDSFAENGAKNITGNYKIFPVVAFMYKPLLLTL